MKSFLSRWLQRDQQISGNDTSANSGFVNFSGKVISCIGHSLSHSKFIVRGDNRRSYKVRTVSSLAHLMGQGARVRIIGEIKEGIVWADSIIPLEKDRRLQLALAKCRY